MKAKENKGQAIDGYSKVKAGVTEKQSYNSEPVSHAAEHKLNVSKSGQRMEGIVEDEGINKVANPSEKSVTEKKSYNSIPQKMGESTIFIPQWRIR